MTTDRRLVFAVVGFLALVVVICLVVVAGLVAGIVGAYMVAGIVPDATVVALLGLITAPMTGSLGAITGLLINTRTNPEEGTP